MYTEELGRWPAPDKLIQYMSPYLFVGNDPINYMDNLGLFGGYFGNSYHFKRDYPTKKSCGCGHECKKNKLFDFNNGIETNDDYNNEDYLSADCVTCTNSFELKCAFQNISIIVGAGMGFSNIAAYGATARVLTWVGLSNASKFITFDTNCYKRCCSGPYHTQRYGPLPIIEIALSQIEADKKRLEFRKAIHDALIRFFGIKNEDRNNIDLYKYKTFLNLIIDRLHTNPSMGNDSFEPPSNITKPERKKPQNSRSRRPND
jgi:hypothetical protein